MSNERIYKMKFSTIYPLYVQKIERKGRNITELNEVILWLAGYDDKGLTEQIEKDATFEVFFEEAPQINANVDKITGVICGIRVEEIADPLVQKVRWLDKLVDELAKGKSMEKILRA